MNDGNGETANGQQPFTPSQEHGWALAFDAELDRRTDALHDEMLGETARMLHITEDELFDWLETRRTGWYRGVKPETPDRDIP